MLACLHINGMWGGCVCIYTWERICVCEHTPKTKCICVCQRKSNSIYAWTDWIKFTNCTYVLLIDWSILIKFSMRLHSQAGISINHPCTHTHMHGNTWVHICMLKKINECFDVGWSLFCILLNTDINECLEVEGVCFNGRCENTEGGHICTCPSGFMLTSDGKACLGNFFFLWLALENVHYNWLDNIPLPPSIPTQHTTDCYLVLQ